MFQDIQPYLKTSISSSHTLFQYATESSTKHVTKKKKKKAAAKFTEGVSILTNLDDIGRKNVQVLGTQTIFKPKISAATSKLNFT